ncbi:MAG: hypothetical protein HY304_05655 [candidate division Zixibacteria bacterium]|nr:hypothetical protein [candidate division Zixibacteria bacterium]
MLSRWLIRWFARHDVVREFSFPGDLRQARRILVLMPLALDDLHQSEFFLSRLPQAFPSAKVTLLYPPRTLAPRFYNPYGYKLVVPEAAQVTWWGIPRRAFLGQLFATPYDVIITLNREPTVFHAAVAVASQTPVRIGLSHGMGRPFITVELRHGRGSADLKTEFILFIEMIRKLTVTPSPTAV